MRLTIVVPVLGQHELANLAIQKLVENIILPDTRIMVVDNGGDYMHHVSYIVTKYRPTQNLGVYPVFKYAFEKDYADILAFFHSDLIVVEKGFDERIVRAFEFNPLLGMAGFIGSNEIDMHGGRGGGTYSNFQGNSYEYGPTSWIGSPASAHGMQGTTDRLAAVVDGCAMVVRREAWNKIGYREDFPPHHFYDRLISTQMLEAGYKIFTMPIACDHISGQTVGGKEYFNFANEWCEKNGIFGASNPDHVVYLEAETRWLREYRDTKHLVPVRV